MSLVLLAVLALVDGPASLAPVVVAAGDHIGAPAVSEGASPGEQPASDAGPGVPVVDRDEEIRTSLAELARALSAAGARPVQAGDSRAVAAEIRAGAEHRTVVALIEMEGRTWVPLEVAVTHRGKLVCFITHDLRMASAGRGPQDIESASPAPAGSDGQADLRTVREFLVQHPDSHIRLVKRG